jgi:hypothetical protein
MNDELKFDSVEDAISYIEDNNFTPAQVKNLIKNEEVDIFSKLVLCIASENPMDAYLDACANDDRIINIWNNQVFKSELLKSAPKYCEILNRLINENLRELKDELSDDSLQDVEKLYILESLGKYPFNFSSPKTLDESFDSQVASFLVEKSLLKDSFENDLVKIKLENVDAGDVEKHAISRMIPFLEESNYREMLFKYNNLSHYIELLEESVDDVLEITVQEELIAKLGKNNIFSEINAMPAVSENSAVLISYEDVLVDLGNPVKQKLLKDFFPVMMYNPSQISIIQQVSSVGIQPKINLSMSNDEVYISYAIEKNPVVSQFFLNFEQRIQSVFKRQPASAKSAKEIAMMFSDKVQSQDILSEFDSLLGMNDKTDLEIRKESVKKHIDLILPELEEVFSTLPQMEGYTSFYADVEDVPELEVKMILDNNQINIKEEDNKLVLSMVSSEDSLMGELNPIISNFVNNMNFYIEGSGE